MRAILLLLIFLSSAALAETVTVKSNPNITVIFEDSVTDSARKQILDGIDLVQDFYWKETRTKIEHKLNVVAYMTNGFARQNIPSAYRSSKCDGGYTSGINGEISRYSVICLSSDVFKRAAKSGPGKLEERQRGLAIHELVHVYQSIWSNGAYNIKDEPYWMPESDANYVAQQLRYVPRRSDQAMLEKWLRDADVKISISRIKRRSDFDRYIPHSYANTALATLWLVNRFGMGGVKTYWTEVGRTNSFAQAFQRAYGMTPSAFYQAFEYGE